MIFLTSAGKSQAAIKAVCDTESTGIVLDLMDTISIEQDGFNTLYS